MTRWSGLYSISLGSLAVPIALTGAIIGFLSGITNIDKCMGDGPGIRDC
jgi:hypothetical protein